MKTRLSTLLGDEIDSWAGEIDKSSLPGQFLVDYVRACSQNMAPMTFNFAICRDGTMAEVSVEPMHRRLLQQQPTKVSRGLRHTIFG